MNRTGLFELNLPPRTLHYGLYRTELNVSMVEEPAIDNAGSVTINIIPSPLVGHLGGGPIKYVKFNFNQTFDAGEFTFDPDLDDASNKSGMTFQWLCKRSCESWPGFDSQYNIIDTNYVSNCAPSEFHGIVNNAGCLSNVPQDFPGIQNTNSCLLLKL